MMTVMAVTAVRVVMMVVISDGDCGGDGYDDDDGGGDGNGRGDDEGSDGGNGSYHLLSTHRCATCFIPFGLCELHANPLR